MGALKLARRVARRSYRLTSRSRYFNEGGLRGREFSPIISFRRRGGARLVQRIDADMISHAADRGKPDIARTRARANDR